MLVCRKLDPTARTKSLASCCLATTTAPNSTWTDWRGFAFFFFNFFFALLCSFFLATSFFFELLGVKLLILGSVEVEVLLRVIWIWFGQTNFWKQAYEMIVLGIQIIVVNPSRPLHLAYAVEKFRQVDIMRRSSWTQ